ncbi:uncharacterized protein N7496_006035 [Penicillium cataractarum]|uniref:Uncharacterized protein n=1 Tax=Penicillium cataractarum TaxID=2100454 RepID=A0A9W9S5G6_9EURO|nr:uncharacterized protein N7496_006035 [Penicillium cataractarum]KAJ5369943.1 hypothetical protein N7496_006035 [Penicillium cataractarum]
MPRVPAVPAPARVVRRSAAGGQTSTRALRTLRTGVDQAPHYVSKGAQIRSTGPATPPPKMTLRKEMPTDFEIVHENCTKMIKSAEERHHRLMARLTEQQQEASEAEQRFRAERAQLNARVRQTTLEKQKAVEEVRKLREQNSALQQRLDTVSSDCQNHITRDEFHMTLKELHSVSSSVTDKITSKMNESQESQYVYFGTCLPGPDVAQDSWTAQTGQFTMAENPLLPESTGPLFDASNPQNLSEFDTYGTMPDGMS